ncbi:MAG: GxxExxY protein [Bacteroidales bacterium]|nr:GxxExxY protein [Candidatus Sodaliphilus fimicaballi]
MEISRENLPEPLHNALRNYVYDVISCMHEVYHDLGNGLPEYVYQEALMIELQHKGFNPIREYIHHPVYKGKELKAVIRMDIMIPGERGNVIIECKAIEKLSGNERNQVYGYLRGTGFPIALLVNFGSNIKAEIERYYYKDGVVRAF